ncbi:hypothetical protein BE221DRAFT_163606 [Ostreococcus tauri]|uniref:Uncharacterized protein n=1 Tax=Ostreococcus tauri TaxID=70448 RepID=A0A1Y5HXT0_OSTTA|nr:hypothetical protein BE221DRAFT_163606 [Ostreococcus tauri]
MTQDGVSRGTPTRVFTLYKFRQVFATRDMCARIIRRRGSEVLHISCNFLCKLGQSDNFLQG